MVICLERDADLHMAQMMPLPLTACSPGKRAVKRVCVCVVDSFSLVINDFYRAMLCIRGTSHGPVSVRVRPSVCHKSEFY